MQNCLRDYNAFEEVRGFLLLAAPSSSSFMAAAGGKNTLLAEALSGRPHLYYQATTSILTQRLEDSAAGRLPERLQFDAVGSRWVAKGLASDPEERILLFSPGDLYAV